jgi:pimeloyl-ACP methyl ester carboxylesterase
MARKGASERERADTVPEAVPRLDAALAFLKQRNILNIVIVAHSHGADMAAHYLATRQPQEVRAFVAIGMGADPGKREEGNLGALRKLKLPTLDLYGEHDLPTVKDSVGERRQAARDAENTTYRQIMIAGADHFFRHQNDLLLSRVRAWLAREAGGSEVGVK